MPGLFDIQSASGTYSVISERNALTSLFPSLREGVVLADVYFAKRLAEQGIDAIAISANETTKDLANLPEVIIRMREAGVNRNTHLWAVGGGAIQDVAGFLSSIYMRGISWTYLPTTLLSMVDSCIGGKSSINVGAYKNIVGTFHIPRNVMIDVTLASTLTSEQRISGLIEAAKICYCRGENVFAEYLSFDPSVTSALEQLESIIVLSLRSKKWFVEIDEFDRAERLVLNLGHTFGHALESASEFRISHGVGVGIGILCAAALSSQLLARAPTGAAPSLEQHVFSLLKGLTDLRKVARDINLLKALDRFKADKKHEAKHYRFITFDASGHVQLIRLPKNDDTHAKVIAALGTTLEKLSS